MALKSSVKMFNLTNDKRGANLKYTEGISLAVQWLGLLASTAGGMGSIPGWGTKVLHAAQCSQKNKK